MTPRNCSDKIAVPNFGMLPTHEHCLSFRFCFQGGLRAVVWVDVMQMGIMIGTMLLLVIIAGIKTGSASDIMDKAIEGGRMNFNKYVTLGCKWLLFI